MSDEHARTASRGSAGGGWDERNLRADIVATWSEYGAHADVFDFMLAEIEALRKAVRLAHDGWIVTEEPALIAVDQFGDVQDEWTHPAVERAVDSGRSGGDDV